MSSLLCGLQPQVTRREVPLDASSCVASSSYNLYYDAPKAVDGNGRTYWSSTRPDEDAAWQYSLASPAHVQSIEITPFDNMRSTLYMFNVKLAGSGALTPAGEIRPPRARGPISYVLPSGLGPIDTIHVTFHGHYSPHIEEKYHTMSSFRVFEKPPSTQVHTFGQPQPLLHNTAEKLLEACTSATSSAAGEDLLAASQVALFSLARCSGSAVVFLMALRSLLLHPEGAAAAWQMPLPPNLLQDAACLAGDISAWTSPHGSVCFAAESGASLMAVPSKVSSSGDGDVDQFLDDLQAAAVAAGQSGTDFAPDSAPLLLREASDADASLGECRVLFGAQSWGKAASGPVQTPAKWDISGAYCVKITDDGISVSSQRKNSFAMMHAGLTSGVHAWELVLSHDKDGGECSCFGLAQRPVPSVGYADNQNMWLVRAFNGKLYHRGRLLEGKRASKCRAGSRVRLVYNANSGTLAYTVFPIGSRSAVDCGVLLRDVVPDIPGAPLYPVVAFYSGGRQVDIASPVCSFNSWSEYASFLQLADPSTPLSTLCCSAPPPPPAVSSPSRALSATDMTSSMDMELLPLSGSRHTLYSATASSMPCTTPSNDLLPVRQSSGASPGYVPSTTTSDAASASIDPSLLPWACSVCTLENEAEAQKCAICDADRPAPVLSRPEETAPHATTCPVCTFDNELSADMCCMCGSELPQHAGPGPPPSGASAQPSTPPPAARSGPATSQLEADKVEMDAMLEDWGVHSRGQLIARLLRHVTLLAVQEAGRARLEVLAQSDTTGAFAGSSEFASLAQLDISSPFCIEAVPRMFGIIHELLDDVLQVLHATQDGRNEDQTAAGAAADDADEDDQASQSIDGNNLTPLRSKLAAAAAGRGGAASPGHGALQARVAVCALVYLFSAQLQRYSESNMDPADGGIVAERSLQGASQHLSQQSVTACSSFLFESVLALPRLGSVFEEGRLEGLMHVESVAAGSASSFSAVCDPEHTEPPAPREASEHDDDVQQVQESAADSDSGSDLDTGISSKHVASQLWQAIPFLAASCGKFLGVTLCSATQWGFLLRALHASLASTATGDHLPGTIALSSELLLGLSRRGSGSEALLGVVEDDLRSACEHSRTASSVFDLLNSTESKQPTILSLMMSIYAVSCKGLKNAAGRSEDSAAAAKALPGLARVPPRDVQRLGAAVVALLRVYLTHLSAVAWRAAHSQALLWRNLTFDLHLWPVETAAGLPRRIAEASAQIPGGTLSPSTIPVSGSLGATSVFSASGSAAICGLAQLSARLLQVATDLVEARRLPSTRRAAWSPLSASETPTSVNAGAAAPASAAGLSPTARRVQPVSTDAECEAASLPRASSMTHNDVLDTASLAVLLVGAFVDLHSPAANAANDSTGAAMRDKSDGTSADALRTLILPSVSMFMAQELKQGLLNFMRACVALGTGAAAGSDTASAPDAQYLSPSFIKACLEISNSHGKSLQAIRQAQVELVASAGGSAASPMDFSVLSYCHGVRSPAFRNGLPGYSPSIHTALDDIAAAKWRQADLTHALSAHSACTAFHAASSLVGRLAASLTAAGEELEEEEALGPWLRRSVLVLDLASSSPAHAVGPAVATASLGGTQQSKCPVKLAPWSTICPAEDVNCKDARQSMLQGLVQIARTHSASLSSVGAAFPHAACSISAPEIALAVKCALHPSVSDSALAHVAVGGSDAHTLQRPVLEPCAQSRAAFFQGMAATPAESGTNGVSQALWTMLSWAKSSQRMSRIVSKRFDASDHSVDGILFLAMLWHTGQWKVAAQAMAKLSSPPTDTDAPSVPVPAGIATLFGKAFVVWSWSHGLSQSKGNPEGGSIQIDGAVLNSEDQLAALSMHARYAPAVTLGQQSSADAGATGGALSTGEAAAGGAAAVAAASPEASPSLGPAMSGITAELQAASVANRKRATASLLRQRRRVAVLPHASAGAARRAAAARAATLLCLRPACDAADTKHTSVLLDGSAASVGDWCCEYIREGGAVAPNLLTLFKATGLSRASQRKAGLQLASAAIDALFPPGEGAQLHFPSALNSVILPLRSALRGRVEFHSRQLATRSALDRAVSGHGIALYSGQHMQTVEAAVCKDISSVASAYESALLSVLGRKDDSLAALDIGGVGSVLQPEPLSSSAAGAGAGTGSVGTGPDRDLPATEASGSTIAVWSVQHDVCKAVHLAPSSVQLEIQAQWSQLVQALLQVVQLAHAAGSDAPATEAASPFAASTTERHPYCLWALGTSAAVTAFCSSQVDRHALRTGGFLEWCLAASSQSSSGKADGAGKNPVLRQRMAAVATLCLSLAVSNVATQCLREGILAATCGVTLESAELLRSNIAELLGKPASEQDTLLLNGASKSLLSHASARQGSVFSSVLHSRYAHASDLQRWAGFVSLRGSGEPARLHLGSAGVGGPKDAFDTIIASLLLTCQAASGVLLSGMGAAFEQFAETGATSSQTRNLQQERAEFHLYTSMQMLLRCAPALLLHQSQHMAAAAGSIEVPVQQLLAEYQGTLPQAAQAWQTAATHTASVLSQDGVAAILQACFAGSPRCRRLGFRFLRDLLPCVAVQTANLAARSVLAAAAEAGVVLFAQPLAEGEPHVLLEMLLAQVATCLCSSHALPVFAAADGSYPTPSSRSSGQFSPAAQTALLPRWPHACHSACITRPHLVGAGVAEAAVSADASAVLRTLLLQGAAASPSSAAHHGNSELRAQWADLVQQVVLRGISCSLRSLGRSAKAPASAPQSAPPLVLAALYSQAMAAACFGVIGADSEQLRPGARFALASSNAAARAATTATMLEVSAPSQPPAQIGGAVESSERGPIAPPPGPPPRGSGGSSGARQLFKRLTSHLGIIDSGSQDRATASASTAPVEQHSAGASVAGAAFGSVPSAPTLQRSASGGRGVSKAAAAAKQQLLQLMHEPKAEGTVVGMDAVSGLVLTVLDVDAEKSLAQRCSHAALQAVLVSSSLDFICDPRVAAHLQPWSQATLSCVLVPPLSVEAAAVPMPVPVARGALPITGKVASMSRSELTLVSTVPALPGSFGLNSSMLDVFANILVPNCIVPAADSEGPASILVAPGLTADGQPTAAGVEQRNGVCPSTNASIADIDAGTVVLTALRSKAMQAFMVLLAHPGNAEVALGHGMLPLIMSLALSASPLPEFVALPWLHYKAQQLLAWRVDTLRGASWVGDAARREEGAAHRLHYLLDDLDADGDGNQDEPGAVQPGSPRQRAGTQGRAAGVLPASTGPGTALSPADSKRREQAEQLAAMGYDVSLCMKALGFNRDDPQRAAEWLLSGQGDAFVRAGGMEAANKDAESRGADPRAADARELAVMVGLPQRLCAAVLEMSQGDRNTATEWLLEHGQAYATFPEYLESGSSRYLSSAASSRGIHTGVELSERNVLDDVPAPRGPMGADSQAAGGAIAQPVGEQQAAGEGDAAEEVPTVPVVTAGGTRGALDVLVEPVSSASGGGITGSTLFDGQVVLLLNNGEESAEVALLGDELMQGTVVGGTLGNHEVDVRVGHPASGHCVVMRVPLDTIRVVERLHGHPARDTSSVAFQSAAVESTLAVHAARRAVLSLLVAWPAKTPFSVRALGGPSRLLSLAKVVAASECIFGESHSQGSGQSRLGAASTSPLMLVVQAKLLRMIEQEVQTSISRGGGATAGAGSGILPALVDDCVQNVREATSPQDSKQFAVRESLHPAWPQVEYSGYVSFEGAKALIVTFDPATSLPSQTGAYSRLQFYTAKGNGTRVGRPIRNIKGGASLDIRPIIVHGDKVAYTYNSKASELQSTAGAWGYRFYVAPMAGLQWLREEQVLHSPSLEWACWLLRLLQGAAPAGHADAAAALVHSPNVANALLSYITTPSMPFKSLVVNILSQLLQRPYLYRQHYQLYAGGRDGRPITKAAFPNFGGLLAVEDVVLGAIREARVHQTVFLPSQLQALAEMCAAARSANMALHAGQGPLVPFDVSQAFEAHFFGTKLKQPVAKSEAIPAEASLDVRGFLLDVYDMSRALLSFARQPDRILLLVAVAMDKGWEGFGSATQGIDPKGVSDASIITAVRGLAGWTFAMDEQLVKFATFASTEAGCGVDSVDPNVVGAKSDLVRRSGDLEARFPNLSQADKAAIQARLALVQLFNRRLARCIESVDLSRTAVKWSLAAHLRQLGHIILPDTKSRLVDAAIAASWAPGSSNLRVTLDNSAAFASDNIGVQDPALSDCVFMQCFRQLRRARPAAFRCKVDERERLFYVSFRGEAGVDWGGMYRESITRCVEDVFSDKLDLLIRTPNGLLQDGMCTDKFLPNPERTSPEMVDAFVFLGRLMGISMRQKLYLPFEFPPMVWRYLTGQELSMNEITDVDRETGLRLQRIAGVKETDADHTLAGETFTVLSASGNLVELVGNGVETEVSPADAHTFVKLAVQFRLHEFDAALEALRRGFTDVVPQRVLSLCSAAELEVLTCGDPVIDVELLKAKTTYHGYHQNDRTCKHFWAVMRSLPNEDRSRFIRFVWGRSRLPKPSEWSSSEPFKFTKKSGGDGALPIAHTCFRQLECPAYSSEDIMRQRLMTAMNFGMDGFLIA